ncbi:TNF15 factor, partial [Polyodon spathula]|nr:TNF15 factor [Polyodon spathula]
MARSLTSSEEVENQFLLWEHQHGQAFLKNGLDYQDNALVFPISGDYFVYAQVTFREIYKKEKCEPRMLKQTITKVTDKYPVPTELATASKSVCETEYAAINAMLDQINSCLDDLEERNDSLNTKLKELLESNRQARQEFRQQLNEGLAQTPPSPPPPSSEQGGREEH